MPSEESACSCRAYPAGGYDPGPLVAEGKMRLIEKIVHSAHHCTEHRLECTSCGKRWWVVEDDTSHWSYRGYSWTPHRPLDLI